jgi:hypothetical protein
MIVLVGLHESDSLHQIKIPDTALHPAWPVGIKTTNKSQALKLRYPVFSRNISFEYKDE